MEYFQKKLVTGKPHAYDFNCKIEEAVNRAVVKTAAEAAAKEVAATAVDTIAVEAIQVAVNRKDPTVWKGRPNIRYIWN